jgi:hypothetical protein
MNNAHFGGNVTQVGLIYIGQNAMERLSKLLSYNNLKENH